MFLDTLFRIIVISILGVLCYESYDLLTTYHSVVNYSELPIFYVSFIVSISNRS